MIENKVEHFECFYIDNVPVVSIQRVLLALAIARVWIVIKKRSYDGQN